MKMRWLAVPIALTWPVAGCTENVQQPSSSASESQAAALVGDAAPAPSPPRRLHGPPPEAFDACQAKAVGAACTVTFGPKSVAGTCTAAPPGIDDTRAACRPNDMPPPPDGGRGHLFHGPPPEAFTACEGKTAGATCTVAFDAHTLDGTCLAPPPHARDAGESCLACAPPHPHHPPHAPPQP